MASAVQTRELDCAADIQDVWRIVSDTDRMGRAMGFEKIEVKPLEGAGAARFLVSTKIAGFLVEYEERPFEWTEPERFFSLRVCRRGPFKKIATTWTLARRPGGGTHARIDVEIEPRLAIMGPVMRAAAGKSAASHIRELQLSDERLKRGAAPFVLTPAHAAAGAALDRAAASLRALASGSRGAAVVDKLVELVRNGADPDVGRLRPFELAERWGVDRRDAVTVCLQAVQAGLLDLRWTVVCPSCRGAPGSTDELSHIGPESSCPMCEITFGVDQDRAIEATFRPAPAVRAVEDAPVCISGPSRVPHVLAQRILPALGEVELRVPDAPGRYRLFVRGGATACVDVEAGAASEARVVADGGAVSPTAIDVAPGGVVRVERHAGGGGEAHVKLERAEWASQAATAWYVSTLPAFRRLFSSQVLRPGLSLKVARAAILFSDLTASTALYAREGDAAAFKLVQDHFDALGAVVERHRGAVVKTIGDAIMAVFDDEADAVRGALDMQRAFADFRARNALARAGEVHLKIGVHAGPCYVVTANKVLDYFGQSVNVAARLQAKAEAGEVVVAESLADCAHAGGWLEGARITERFVTPIKGLDAPVAAARLVAGAAGAASSA
jgi:class 3 adenylate cyclase